MSQQTAIPVNEFVNIVAKALSMGLIRREEGSAQVANVGPYYFEYQTHPTGQQLQIHAIIGEEKLLVFRRDLWVSGGYEFNNDRTIQGFQSEGPWIEQVTDIVIDWRRQIEAREITQLQEIAARQKVIKNTEDARLEKFRRALSRESASSLQSSLVTA